jgi:broad specificity phosphatase PhoE
MKIRSILTIAAIVAGFAAHARAASNDALWELLKGGGQVILMRHTITTPGVGDPPGIRIGDCSTQRNLTEEGRRHAQQIGEAVRAHGIPVDKVLSSPMCRCLDTARLAFGRVDEPQGTASLHARGEEKSRQVREMRALAGEKHRGGNVVLVSHGSTIDAVTGVATEPGEMVIVTPKGDGRFDLQGKLMAAPPALATQTR